jgi:hypothetical protein
MFSAVAVVLFCGQPASAQEYSIKKMTPEINQALENRRDRYDRLAELKKQGAVGENNRGYVEVLSGGEARSIADAENKDRRVIYQAITEQNTLGENALLTVEKVFAQVQQEKAAPGDKIQAEDGRWISK